MMYLFATKILNYGCRLKSVSLITGEQVTTRDAEVKVSFRKFNKELFNGNRSVEELSTQ